MDSRVSHHIYIVDDDMAFVDSLRWILEPQNYKIHGFSDPQAAMHALCDVVPTDLACLLLDIRMPVMSGLDLHDQLIEAGVDIPIVYLTGHADVALAVEAMSKGALTFLEKPIEDGALDEALLKAFSPTVQTQRQSVQRRALSTEQSQLLDTLSAREAEVLAGIMEGQSAKAIAQSLFISAKTVDYHRTNLYKKLKVKNVAQLQRMVAVSQT